MGILNVAQKQHGQPLLNELESIYTDLH